MKKIQAIIVDDEARSRNIMRKMLDSYCPRVSVVEAAASIEEAELLFQRYEPHLLLLDIEMPYGSGFELLKRLEKYDFEVIFVTGFSHYALKALKAKAFDYLLKPVDIDELVEAINKVEAKILEKMKARQIQSLYDSEITRPLEISQIALPTFKGKLFVKTSEIIRCEADGHCTYFFLENKTQKVVSSRNLGTYYKLLSKSTSNSKDLFLRIHHSHLINCSFMRSYIRHDNMVEMKNGDLVPISKRRKGDFIESLKKLGLY